MYRARSDSKSLLLVAVTVSLRVSSRQAGLHGTKTAQLPKLMRELQLR